MLDIIGAEVEITKDGMFKGTRGHIIRDNPGPDERWTLRYLVRISEGFGVFVAWGEFTVVHYN